MSDLIDNPAMIYVKKPVKVEAVKLDSDNYERVVSWIESLGGETNGGGIDEDGEYINIQTLEGNMRADEGDYVIRGIKGEFYPCKPDIFEASYENAAEQGSEPLELQL